jgi:hypothetical protein
VYIALRHEVATDRLPGSPLKQHVVRYDDRTSSIDLQ